MPGGSSRATEATGVTEVAGVAARPRALNRNARHDTDRVLPSRIEKQPTDLRQNTSYFGDRTLDLFQERLYRAVRTKIVLCQPLVIKKLRLVFVS